MDTRPRLTETPKPPDGFYLSYILKIAAGAAVEISETTQAVYLERIRQLSPTEIQTATSRTLEEWSEASKMPPLAFILERTGAADYREDRRLLDRDDKPPDWVAIGRRAGISSEQIQEWMDAGKEAQNEHIAKLEADPEWERMARSLGGFPGLTPRESTVPSDPGERQTWASQRVKALGWI